MHSNTRQIRPVYMSCNIIHTQISNIFSIKQSLFLAAVPEFLSRGRLPLSGRLLLIALFNSCTHTPGGSVTSFRAISPERAFGPTLLSGLNPGK